MGKTVLIAANDPHIAYLMQRYARRSGFETLQTPTAEEVPGVAQKVHPALIILEMDSLPQSEGALQQLSENAVTSGIPVVAYTSCDQGPEDCAPHIAAHLRASVLYDDFVGVLRQVGVYPLPAAEGRRTVGGSRRSPRRST